MKSKSQSTHQLKWEKFSSPTAAFPQFLQGRRSLPEPLGESVSLPPEAFRFLSAPSLGSAFCGSCTMFRRTVSMRLFRVATSAMPSVRMAATPVSGTAIDGLCVGRQVGGGASRALPGAGGRCSSSFAHQRVAGGRTCHGMDPVALPLGSPRPLRCLPPVARFSAAARADSDASNGAPERVPAPGSPLWHVDTSVGTGDPKFQMSGGLFAVNETGCTFNRTLQGILVCALIRCLVVAPRRVAVTPVSPKWWNTH